MKKAMIEFMNADLEITSDVSLEPLRNNLVERKDLFFEMCCEKFDDHFFASFEIHPEGIEDPTAVQLIEAFCEAIDQLRDENRQLWDAALSRKIDLGYQCQNHCPAFRDEIPVSTLQRMTALNISLAFTLYPETIKND